jgi:hypothetical protein
MDAALDNWPKDADGRLALAGAETLPPMEPPSTGRHRNGKPERRHGTGKATRTTRDRFGVLNALVDGTLDGLTGAETKTWLILYRDTRDGTAATSQAEIARRAGLSVRGVQKALRRLLDRGLVEMVKRGGINRGPSRYRVHPLANRGSG